MGSIFAYFNKSGDHSPNDVVEDALKEMNHWGPDFTDKWNNSVLGLGCHVLYTSPLSVSEKIPYWHEQSGCCIISDARIDYKKELAAELCIDQDEWKRLPDSQLILRSYLKWKDSCTNHLYGDFSFIIWNKNTQEIFCARDHFGSRPLYYINHEKFFAISSELKGFQAIPNFSLQVKELSLLEVMCSIIPNKDVSAFKGILRLEPATNLKFSPEGTIQLTRYWDLLIIPEYTDLTEDEAIQGVKKRFIDAVTQRSASGGPNGVELSGGLDSSSVASCLSSILNGHNQIFAFSHAMPEKGLWQSSYYKDELSFSKQITTISGITQHHIIRGDSETGSFSALQNLVAERLMPEIQFFATLSDLLLEEAKQSGVNVLLSGYGGDEGVTNSGIGVLGEYVKNREYGKLKQALKDKVRRNGGNYYKQFIKQYLLVVAPWIIKLIRKNWRKARYNSVTVNKKLLMKYSMKRRYFKYSAFPIKPDVRIRQYYRIMHPHVPDRLEASFITALSKRIEYRYPFLDVKLLEFYYSLNSNSKYKHGFSRYLFREAMKGTVHEEVRLRTDKTYATIPNAFNRLVQDEFKYRNIINEGEKNNRFHYADYNKLHRMLDGFNDKKKIKKVEIGITSFLSTISVLILQKWQREGKIDIGIKC